MIRSEPTLSPAALDAIRAPFLAVGAERVDTPIVQPLSLLLDLAGEALRARLFVVQAEGGDEACLRPDFTVPVARLHLDRGAPSGRYLYEGHVFRASPGDDRPEEMLQIGLERYDPGETAPTSADIEIVALAWAAAKAGGRQDLSLWLGDVALFAAFIATLDLSPTLSARLARAAGRPRLLLTELARAGQRPVAAGEGDLARFLSALPPDRAGKVLEEVWSLAGIEPVGGRGPHEIAQRLIRKGAAAQAPALTPAQAQAIQDFLSIESPPAEAMAAIGKLAGPKAGALNAVLDQWRDRLETLSDGGISAFRFATALGHAFDYYDGLFFEVRSAALGADQPVAVGGRYDGLPARMGAGAGARAIGCMVRPGRAAAEVPQ